MAVTAKQEKFVQGLIKGLSQADAYREAYNAEKMSDNAIYVAASKLMGNPKVRLRYEELQKQLEDEAIMSAQERMKWLTGVIKGTTQEEVLMVDKEGGEVKKQLPAKLDTRLKAMDQLNKMSGEYKTILDGSVEVNKKLEDLL